MSKKTLTLAAIILIAGVGILIMNACTKNENSVQTQKSYKYVEFMPSNEDVIPLIKDFNAVYENYKQGLKSGVDYPLNEALWNLEAGVNYEYRSVKDGLAELVEDSTFVTVPVTVDANGNYIVNGDDLAAAYSNLLNFTGEELTAGGENRTLLVADVEMKNVTPQSATMKMTTSSATPSNPSCEIENDDYWYFADELGKCGSYVGQNIGEDATTRINYILNACHDYGCENGVAMIVNIETKTDITNYQNTYLPTGENNSCMNPTEMQDDLDKALIIIDGHTPINKDFVSCHFMYSIIVGSGNGRVHVFEYIKYGRILCIEE